ncbi:MAG: glycosyltransferase family A protein [Euryarchaeota archaeon]|nr:glycosyltransferase family A protein [Euryarchaeota archaeon]
MKKRYKKKDKNFYQFFIEIVVMKISVIIPTYNREKLLKETVDSILRQTFQDFELIIVDNFSVDNTENIVYLFHDDRIRYYKHQNNGIIAVNRNFGIKKARGEFIAFCDDDDLWLPQKLEKQLLEFERDGKIGLVCTNGFSFNEHGKTESLGKSSSRYFTLNNLLIENTIACSSVMVKKSVLTDVGIFDESREIFTGEDYELWLRVAKRYRIKYLGTPLFKYRIHTGALQKTYVTGKITFELYKEIFVKLLHKKIIDAKLYKRAVGRLNYKNLIFKLLNSPNEVDMKTILIIEMNIWERIILMLVFFLFRVKILDMMRRVHIRYNVLHIR